MSRWTNEEKKCFMNTNINLVLSNNRPFWFTSLTNDEQTFFVLTKLEDVKNPKVKPAYFAAKYKSLLNDYYVTTDRGYKTQLPFKL